MATIKNLISNDYHLGTEGYFTDPQYEVPSGKKTLVKEIVLYNSSIVSRPVTIQICPSGGPNYSHCIFRDMAVDAKQTITFKTNIIMESEYELWAFTNDFGVIMLRISGRET